MNANELADALVNTDYTPLKAECAAMLRQLQAENEELVKGTVILAKDFVKEQIKNKRQQAEIEILKSLLTKELQEYADAKLRKAGK